MTFTFAPNFFLAKLRGVIVDNGTSFRGEAKVDLSCLRGILYGGESNVVATCAALAEQLPQFGAPSNFIRPGYGLTDTFAGSHGARRFHRTTRLEGWNLRLLDVAFQAVICALLETMVAPPQGPTRLESCNCQAQWFFRNTFEIYYCISVPPSWLRNRRILCYVSSNFCSARHQSIGRDC